jgi:hypothetical protein
MEKRDYNRKRLGLLWGPMVARDAASIICKFNEDTEILGANLNECPTLLGKIDTTAKRLATRLFVKSFAAVWGVRDSAQHRCGDG